MTLEENMHDVNNSGNEYATEDVSMDETSSDEFTAEDEYRVFTYLHPHIKFMLLCFIVNSIGVYVLIVFT